MITIYPCINDGLEGNLWFSALWDEPNSFIFQIVWQCHFHLNFEDVSHTHSPVLRGERDES